MERRKRHINTIESHLIQDGGITHSFGKTSKQRKKDKALRKIARKSRKRN